jgi:hypothetical protein
VVVVLAVAKKQLLQPIFVWPYAKEMETSSMLTAGLACCI